MAEQASASVLKTVFGPAESHGMALPSGFPANSKAGQVTCERLGKHASGIMLRPPEARCATQKIGRLQINGARIRNHEPGYSTLVFLCAGNGRPQSFNGCHNWNSPCCNRAHSGSSDGCTSHGHDPPLGPIPAPRGGPSSKPHGQGASCEGAHHSMMANAGRGVEERVKERRGHSTNLDKLCNQWLIALAHEQLV